MSAWELRPEDDADLVTRHRLTLALVEFLETSIYERDARISALEEQVRGMQEVLGDVAALDECEAHIEDGFERLLPKIKAALATGGNMVPPSPLMERASVHNETRIER